MFNRHLRNFYSLLLDGECCNTDNAQRHCEVVIEVKEENQPQLKQVIAFSIDMMHLAI